MSRRSQSPIQDIMDKVKGKLAPAKQRAKELVKMTEEEVQDFIKQKKESMKQKQEGKGVPNRYNLYDNMAGFAYQGVYNKQYVKNVMDHPVGYDIEKERPKPVHIDSKPTHEPYKQIKNVQQYWIGYGPKSF